ncbi:glycoside hydrolase family 5 protein [Periconia macrospinosa]|uniref:glucan endo-1,6-beta-glucosidase n=1 Tax=Periconia macrospinosa TaxID=97972 RepID=A0A2V1DQJ9_9PLEO|nr:glycoside hydrolase family 5 protein [Periconia macrospinosa]
MKCTIVNLLALSGAVTAWLPSERNLFGEQPNSVARNLPAGQGRSVKRFDPSFNKIRGVNLGSLFIIEPWMASSEWNSMGCGGTNSEFDCMRKLGKEQGNAAFQKHWDSWITEEDMDKMKEFGLNTIRVPVGYWMVEETIEKNSEPFALGSLSKMDRLAERAAKRGMYVILDLHGAPGAQEPNQPFTGQYAPSTGFFNTYNYERAYKFLEVMTERIHKNTAYRTTGMLQVLNEPERNHGSLVTEFYNNAYTRIRNVETKLGITAADKQLTIQFMDKAWGAGNPKDVLNGKSGVAYDDHRYLKWAPIEHTKANYIATSCKDTFGDGGNKPIIVGEWSLAAADNLENTPEWKPATNKDFYKQWWAAQVQAYEREMGWVFWSWKAQLGEDYRWCYRCAVEAGVIPKDPAQAAGLAKC